MIILTPSELKQATLKTSPYYFTHDTMKFFGDTMRNYGVRANTIVTYGGRVEVWELYRKKPVKHGNQSSAYFSKRTLHREFVKRR
ncbi:MAG TPA: hypothetical protein ENH41_03440 [Candidatus Omnitrophica bacterium]|nr:hypothetical protein [Candidatus Omnitrophota bacterium]